MKATYKVKCRDAKTYVAIAKKLQYIHEELNNKEGEGKIYKIAKAQQKSKQNKAANIIKDKVGNVLWDLL